MKRFTKYVVALALVFGTVFGLGMVYIARAGATPSNCQDDLWWTLQATRRLLCDGPISEDGSWMRRRQMYTPEHYVPFTCYRYSCSGGYHVDLNIASDEIYPVRPETVLPDEPGHIVGNPNVITLR